MQHYQNLKEINLENSWLTIGSFDGVHIGHQQIIQPLVTGAHKLGLPAAVLTFHPHPLLVINKEVRPFYLTMPEERAQILGRFGVDIVLTYPFSKETAQRNASDFINELFAHFQVTRLWVGHDFALGKDREGDSSTLKELGDLYGYKLHEIPPYVLDDEIISSSLIRRKIREGNIEGANELLGRPLEITGTVVSGANRGKSLGFATSNLDVPEEVVDIKPGVYACLAEVVGGIWQAVTNVGYRPTFGEGLTSPQIEAHLLDFSGDLYGEEMNLRFIERLRDEMKFEEISSLQAQINTDISNAKAILKE